jgi:hypothetical protein
MMKTSSSFSVTKVIFAIVVVEFLFNSFCKDSIVVSAFSFPFSSSPRPRYVTSSAPAMAPLPTPLLRYSGIDDHMEKFTTTTNEAPQAPLSRTKEEERQTWNYRSVTYYSKVMREERRRQLGQINDDSYDPDQFVIMAKKHYFALCKIKDGKPAHAEQIYRRIIGELLVQEVDDNCDHSKFAVTTLLLALLLQREGHPVRSIRRVFLHFFRMVLDSDDECACSAKVLQAFALFEMKQGNSLKSLHIVDKAVQLDPSLLPVLRWKQFRDARKQLEEFQQRAHQRYRSLEG